MQRWLSLLLLCLLPFTVAAEEVGVPSLSSRVTDLTGTLTTEQRATLESKLQTLETEKGSQIAVLMVSTTKPEVIEQYSIRVVEQWKLGRKKIDDGALLLIAKDDHRLRIEVGYGLEGALPDAISKRIIDEDIAPHLKQGDFYGGIVAGITRIDAVIHGEQLPPPTTHRTSKNDSSGIENYLFFLIIFALITGGILRRVLGSFLGGLLNGGLIGLISMFLGIGIMFAIIFGIIAFFFTLINGGHGGGWGGGGFGGGGGFSGGGGGGGGFSGGGGGFGGGGASGDW